jgi:hypothetical protein
MNPAATLNVGAYHTVGLNASATSITTLQSALGPGEMIMFVALASTSQFSTGGNLNLIGYNAPLVLANGETATFVRHDLSATWTLIATTANHVGLLNSQGAVGPLTGNSTDQVVYTYTLPANTVPIDAASGIRVRCGLSHTTGTVNTTVKIILNGVTVASGASGTTASQSLSYEAQILRTSTTTGGSWGIVTNTTGTLQPFTLALAGLAWTSNQTLTCTFNVANTDTWSGVMFTVEQIR